MKKKLFVGGLGIIILLAGGFFVFIKTDFEINNENLKNLFVDNNQEKIERPQKLKNPPSPIRGIYITAWVAGGSSRINELITLIDETELNAVVIDVKDYSGKLSFETNIPLAEEIGAHNEIRIADIDSLIKKLHERNIYVIGRTQVFQDPTLAKARPDLAVQDNYTGSIWRDHKGLSWLDPMSQEVWDYNLDIAREMDERGFDEINFDYIRFPSDGILERMSFPFWDEVTPRYDIIRSFFKYMREETAKDNIIISADLFGMAAWLALDFDYDLNIGQRLIDALPYFDYICPMVYPSHYAGTGTGYKNPAEYPYEIVFTSLKNAQNLIATTTSATAKIRPWLQDFDIGAIYSGPEVRAQIQAAYDNGVEEWLLWNASNRYTREGLEPIPN